VIQRMRACVCAYDLDRFYLAMLGLDLAPGHAPNHSNVSIWVCSVLRGKRIAAISSHGASRTESAPVQSRVWCARLVGRPTAMH
jgi:hypothetical protein